MVIQQTANDVDKIKRSSSLNPYQCWLLNLTRSFRETITREHSQMALPTGPIKEP
jgi:hypothetical protein